MFSDFQYIFTWWLTILLFGFIALPLIQFAFNKFIDIGYIFSKTASLALITFILFVLSSLKLISFSQTSIFSISLLLLVFDYWWLFKKNNYKKFVISLKKAKYLIIGEEIAFLLILTAWSFVRGYNPTIEGLEKYMDWGFINSMLRSTYMPPADMWYSGSPINYYYFGHLIFAMLTKISNISSIITYNLAIATVCALTFVSGFSLSINIIARYLAKKINFTFLIIGGLTSALFLTFGGNLHTVYKITKINIEQNKGELKINIPAFEKASRAYWYPDATRFIGFDPETKDKTIHEFPLYSFVVADLHGHMNDIPIVIMFMAFLFATIYVSKNYINFSMIIPAGLMLSWAYMTNAWDFAVYGLLFAVFYFLTHTNLLKTITNGLAIIAFWYVFTLPFARHFIPMMDGIKISDAQTPFYQLFVLYGGFWLMVLPFLLAITKKKALKPTDLFILALIITATLLIAIPEIIYIKDIYIYEHRRANTMFKLVYQAFMMYSLVSGYVLIRLMDLLKKTKLFLIYKVIFLGVFVSHLIFPYFAIKSYYGFEKYKGLSGGLDYLEVSYPDNYKAIQWINQNIVGQPIMLEAVGDSYTTYNHVSISTGLPTVEGWLVHEWLWRGGYDGPGKRSTDVEKIYTSQSADEVRNLIQKYNIDYIFVGSKEIEKYKELNTENFENLSYKIIFETGKTKIYKIDK